MKCRREEKAIEVLNLRSNAFNFLTQTQTLAYFVILTLLIATTINMYAYYLRMSFTNFPPFGIILQVGYRSLRGSHSISDLSLAGNLDGSRSGVSAANRYAKTGKLTKYFLFIN